MNYIKQALFGKHEWWRYLVGTIVIFLFWQLLGVIPFTVAVSMKFIEDGTIESLVGMDQTTLLQIFSLNITLFLMLFMFAIGLAGIFIVVKYLHKLPLLRLTTSRSRIDWKRVFFAFIIWGIFSSSITLYGYFSTPENFIWNFHLERFLVLAIIAILLIPIQTSFEEYYFRGYLMQGLGVLSGNRHFPLIITSLVFGLLHWANPEVAELGYIVMVYYIGTGLFLGVLTLMDEGIELSLGFHAANNLFTALLVTADWSALQTEALLIDTSEPTVGFDIFIPVLVFYPLLLWLFSKKYKWRNWKEKLTGDIYSIEE